MLPAVAAHADGRAALEAPTTAAERFRYHRALRALIEQLGREKPVALLLDDLHWADDASVEFVLHLLRRPPRTACLAVFALRPLAPAPQLLDAARNAPRCEQIALSPLAHEAALTLLAGVSDRELKERIVREAGGNPLFLEEMARIMRHPGASLPPTLVAAVQLEVQALARASRALIDGAAVAGDPFDPELAAAAAGLDLFDALPLLDELVAVDLLRPTDGRGFRFRHPLVRRAVYDAALPAGGWPPTSAPRARWRCAAPRRPRAPTTSSRPPGPATRPRSRCWPRPPAPRPRPPRDRRALVRRRRPAAAARRPRAALDAAGADGARARQRRPPRRRPRRAAGGAARCCRRSARRSPSP